ncbi:SusC/RagA family TonB-linked outer membrane protein [Rhodocytophaga aerolata]|uniref:SusC/RagA family TonB-linked outer membrane protein n=1 Tax=Rhodocytophaga aerolata TaxID=455078 RepID=A0ABT8QZF4_9BACT|nr:SusC/RagA family TonB-linked outer membrane protein [Rhodocytophaga aerolata]MDO1444791.1 SusC/RagA family TonB-linked outer membrane protein [Rhodocytophaga aerolata]
MMKTTHQPLFHQRNDSDYAHFGKPTPHLIKRSIVSAALTLILVFICTLQTFAQDVTVSGKVTDPADNSPLPGVNITVKGTTTGTVTDGTGAYSISVPGNSTLVYSFIGYTTQEIPVNNRSTIDVALAGDVQALSEVVVIGYGEQKKKDVTGSIAQVSAKDFNAGINPNPLQAIQGKVAGLNITRPSGDPNQAPTVRLRGYTSLAGGSEPLYVVDGIIGVPINSVSPEDIESMDVLKDASAAAIYGARAANGVIIVTTKRGREGKTTVGFNNYVGTEIISNRLELLNGEEYRQEVNRIKGPASLDDNLRFPDGNFSTDWIDEITRVAYTNNHDLSIMGGGSSFSYRGSLNYIQQQGILKNTGFNRLTGRVNIDQRAINDRLKIQYNLSIANTNAQLREDGVISRAVTFLPTLPIKDPGGRSDFGGYYEVDGSFDLFNPVAIQNNFLNDRVRRNLIGGVNMSFEVLDGLVLGANGAFRNESTIESQAFNGVIKQFQGNQGRTARNLYQTNNTLLDLTATYTRNIGANSNFNLLGGYSYQENVDDGFGANNNNYIDGGYDLFGYDNLGRGNGTLLFGRSDYVSSYKNSWKLISFFGRATFNFVDKYNVTATLRRDGSSKFGVNNRWGIFPSFAAGWTISNEPFLQDNRVLSYLKLRAGWGQTGNSEGIRPYNTLRLLGPVQNYYDATAGVAGDFVPGYGYTQNDNPDLKWEVLEQTNVGLDFTLFDRITGTLDVYNKMTRDMLYPFTVAATGGRFVTNSIVANAGTMRNRGIELSIGADIINKENFTWNARVVGAYNENTIMSLNSGDFNVGIIRYNSFGGRGLSNVFASELRPGRSLGEFYIPQHAGFDQNGNMLFVAADGGEPTTDNSKAKLVESGVALPRYTGALINTLRYGNFDLNFQLRGVAGNKILNNLRSNLSIPGSILETNMLKDVQDLPANFSTNQLSDFWLESGAFVRLDNWQLGYNLPMAEGRIVQAARIYLGGNNLFVITKYKGIDPELEVRGDLADNGRSQTPNNIGIDAASVYPKTRSFQLGVNLTF